MLRSTFALVGLASAALVAVTFACGGSDDGGGGVASDGGSGSGSGGGGGSGSGGGGGSGSGSGGGSGGGSGSGSGGSSSGTTLSDGAALTTFGDVHSGIYELGPVEWTGSFWNSCGPYPDAVTKIEGIYLAGLENTYNGDGSLCDACILMTTGKGKSIVLRVVTTGVAKAPTNADISQEAYSLINQGEEPRSMTWQIVQCPATGKLQYQYQTQANTDWTSMWVRNGRVPVTKVEVMSSKHKTWFPLVRAGDGTLTDSGGFGTGSFTLRVTGMDGQTVSDTFPSFAAGALVPSAQSLE